MSNLSKLMRFSLMLLCIALLTSCAGIRRTYRVKGKAEKVEFEYSDSVQRFTPLK